MTLIPAAWHFAMESGTDGLGGSNKDTIPKSLNPDRGKLTFWALNWNPGGNRLGGNLQSATAISLSPKLPISAHAYLEFKC